LGILQRTLWGYIGAHVKQEKDHLGHCIESAIVQGDAAEQRRKANELIQLLERAR
jgi:metal-responsive CopG/Arc/MetJ family transcriptional regulator